MKLSDFDSKDIEVIDPGPKPSLKLSDFHPSQVEHVDPGIDPKTSPVTAATTGLVQGSVPFASSLAGAGKAGLDAITGVRGPLAGGNLDDVLQDYRDTRDSFTQDAATASQAHPAIALASNVAGGLKNPLFQSAHSLPEVAGAAAVQGLGTSKADLTKGEVKEAAIDTGLGAAGGALGYGVGKAIGEGIPALVGARHKIGGYIGEFATGVPAKEIETYSEQTPKINDMIAQSGGDVSVASDTVRENLQKGVRSMKDRLNSQISGVLDQAPVQENISLDPVIMKLQVARAKLNPNLQSEAVSQIDDILNVVGKEANEDGNVNLRTMQEIKNYLYENARPSYLKGGQIFSKASQAQSAAKQAASEALRVINPLSPEIQAANKQLQQLHFIEENLNKNLISPGKPEASLLAAGSGANSRNAAMLKKLGSLTHQDALGEAERLAVVRRFAHPPIAPVDTTGKSALRTLVTTGIGGALGGIPGAIMGGAVSSPAALKAGINASDMVGKMLSSVGNTEMLGKFAPILQQAVKRGPQALAVTFSLLSQDPQFKQILSQIQQ